MRKAILTIFYFLRALLISCCCNGNSKGKNEIKNSMKKYIKLFLIYSLPLIIGCKDNKNTSAEKMKKWKK